MGKPLVLIVEDDRDLAENLTELLRALGYPTLLAEDGAQALEVIEAQDVDGILTDYRLPKLDGVSLLAETRRRHKAIPLVVMSGYLDADGVERAKRLGALDVLDKPLDLQRLRALLTEMEDHDRRVLVVEDDPSLAEVIAEGLRREGFEPAIVGTRKAAFASHWLARVAVVDLELPDGTGAEVAERLRARDSRVRVVFVSRTAGGADGGTLSLSGSQDVGAFVAQVLQACSAA